MARSIGTWISVTALVLGGCASGGASATPAPAPAAPPPPPRRTEPSPTAYVLTGVGSLSDDMIGKIKGCLPASWTETRASRNDLDYACATVGSNSVVRVVQIEMKVETEDERAEIRQLFPKLDEAKRVEVRIRGGDFTGFGEGIGRDTEQAFPAMDDSLRASILGKFVQPAIDEATRAKDVGLWPEAGRRAKAAAGFLDATSGGAEQKALVEQLRAEIKTNITQIAATLGGKVLEHWSGERRGGIYRLLFADAGKTGIVGYTIDHGQRQMQCDLDEYRVVRVPDGLKIRVRARHVVGQQDLYMLRLDLTGVISPTGEFTGESEQSAFTSNLIHPDSSKKYAITGRLVPR